MRPFLHLDVRSVDGYAQIPARPALVYREALLEVVCICAGGRRNDLGDTVGDALCGAERGLFRFAESHRDDQRDQRGAGYGGDDS
jgi:hypothetical protein